MKPTNEKLAADILSAGKKEFLEKGFQGASMRSIASSLAVTTGAIYRYYTDKEAIFEALVEEPAKELANRYRESQQKFAELSLKEQLEGLPDVADHEYVWMVDYVYDHFDAFKLIACCSTGTKYEYYLETLIEIEVNASHLLMEKMQQQGLNVLPLDDDMVHILASSLFNGMFETVRHDTPKEKAVALTFDDGPSRDNDGTILEALQANGAHATFFVLGNRARVDGDIMQMILDAGCEIASHSWDHPQLSKIKWKKAKSQIDRTDRIVSKLLNGYQISLLRPPYGSISKTMRKKVEKPMILWSLDTEDWKSRNAKKVFNRVKKEVKDGDIILMHDIHPETAEAVKKIVPWLSEQGYDMLTVTELMARKGKTMEGGKAYLDAN